MATRYFHTIGWGAFANSNEAGASIVNCFCDLVEINPGSLTCIVFFVVNMVNDHGDDGLDGEKGDGCDGRCGGACGVHVEVQIDDRDGFEGSRAKVVVATCEVIAPALRFASEERQPCAGQRARSVGFPLPHLELSSL